MSQSPDVDRDSEKSDDEIGDLGATGSATPRISGKRVPRACDKCRKSKSKCQPSDAGADRCRSCLAAGTVCTFSGPSFRRGPPKGYIQALESRLHQMESMLAAIMSSKDERARGVIADLRNDALAKSILGRVDSGPFGPSGRQQRSIDPTEDNFFASIIGAAPPKLMSVRSRRQSRSTRESVTQHDPSVSVRPTLEWQDRLSEALACGREKQPGTDASCQPSLSYALSSTGAGSLEGRARQKRRLDIAPSPYSGVLAATSWDELHSIHDPEESELDDCADAFGNLSIDENKEVRYHGNSTGLHMLAQSERTDGRNVGGMWKFPMPKGWLTQWTPGSVVPGFDVGAGNSDGDVTLPPLDVQDHLIELYFTYVHPSIPVLDRDLFMADYNAQKTCFRESSHSENIYASRLVRPEQMQKLSKLLLFAIFAFAARYSDTEIEAATSHGVDMGSRHALCARRVLDTMYQESRTSTCQALVLLGIREFGTGSLEEGWLHVGMAIRMALDLGLNRSAEKWQHDGRELFTPAEKQIRRRIWWACCFADRYSSLFLGRPMAIHESDSSALLPDVPENEGEETWRPCHTNSLGLEVSPIPARFMSCFREAASLSVIVGEIVGKIYPVTHVLPVPRRILMEQLYSRLLQWSINLPEALRYSPASKQPCPPPHVLVLHVQYWAAILLLHRPFIPKEAELQTTPTGESVASDRLPWKALDLCRSAAAQITSFAKAFHNNFDLRWAPPIIGPSFQSAGIIQIIILRSRPSDTQAMLGLQDCMAALNKMQLTWPSAARMRDLLQGAKIQLDNRGATHEDSQRPPKRGAADAFPREDTPPSHPSPVGSHAYAHREAQGAGAIVRLEQKSPAHAFDNFADLLGLDFHPGLPHTPTVPEYWPPHPASDGGGAESQRGHHDGFRGMPSQPFTFGQQQFAPEFMQAIRDPILHFPTAYPAQGYSYGS
ncbi:Nitrogen assimilation transcription factor nit-4 [Sparassis crispa]|uniref:Nitrogen assimilation transcription factor nit-4 n=1 Tax=Sparassis crispa TaxID=139825 RepID=A0A401GH99_9APHY|nr:Nitrogen assimilation transcription factor nit-4 [Sparassis crispa]GBE81567.1 Nitrogen assimilation transcription factor nit-4 [Sparassis crispa]